MTQRAHWQALLHVTSCSVCGMLCVRVSLWFDGGAHKGIEEPFTEVRWGLGCQTHYSLVPINEMEISVGFKTQKDIRKKYVMHRRLWGSPAPCHLVINDPS